MVIVSVDSGDHESLVRCCHANVPRALDSTSSNTVGILRREKEKTLKYPILILGDAYSQCKVPEVRHDIAAVIRRGFSTMNIPGLESDEQTDDDYVSKAMEWYRTHKDDLVVNGEYGNNLMMGRRLYPLFTWKK